MRHVMALVGSRGDVQPALAVALELRRRGHEVVTGVAPNLVPLAGRLGLDPVPLGIDSARLLGSDLVRRDMRSAHPCAGCGRCAPSRRRAGPSCGPG
nr:hypothetical protein GCM10025730_46010 [Promicromonospora thailandica]